MGPNTPALAQHGSRGNSKLGPIQAREWNIGPNWIQLGLTAGTSRATHLRSHEGSQSGLEKGPIWAAKNILEHELCVWDAHSHALQWKGFLNLYQGLTKVFIFLFIVKRPNVLCVIHIGQFHITFILSELTTSHSDAVQLSLGVWLFCASGDTKMCMLLVLHTSGSSAKYICLSLYFSKRTI